MAELNRFVSNIDGGRVGGCTTGGRITTVKLHFELKYADVTLARAVPLHVALANSHQLG